MVSEAWSSAPNTINFTNSGASAQNATQTAGLIFGGRNPPAPAFVSTAEEYNGAGWSAGGALNTARSYLAGFGIQTAAVAAGGRTTAPGSVTAATEEYDGSTWTTNPSPSGDMGSARKMQNGGAGIITAGLAIGPSATEEYGGTTWTAGGALNTARTYLTGFGTQTAAAAAGGHTPPGAYSAAVEEYNGTGWTSVTSIPAVRQAAGCAGIQTDGLIFGGQLPADTNTTFSYDGSTWSAKPNMANAGYAGTGQGTGAAALAANFYSTPGGITRNTEEFNRSADAVTAGAWAAGGALTTGRYMLGGCGLQTAALAFGGTTPSTGKTETYDGTSWTEVADLSTAREEPGSAGTQTAALCIGGQPGGGATTATEEWGGSSWTAGGALPAGKKGSGGLGTQTAALNAGGVDGPGSGVATSEEYNGASWTSGGALPAAKYHFGSSGTQTAGLAFGGSEDKWTTTEEYNGASWTAGGAMIKGAKGLGASTSGTQTDSIGFSGRNPNVTAITNTEGYDGTAWSTRPNVATAKQYVGGAGTSTAALKVGGGPSPATYTGVEEFTGETSAANYKTITTS